MGGEPVSATSPTLGKGSNPLSQPTEGQHGLSTYLIDRRRFYALLYVLGFLKTKFMSKTLASKTFPAIEP